MFVDVRFDDFAIEICVIISDAKFHTVLDLLFSFILFIMGVKKFNNQ